ncbi:hypothetical protein ACRAWD_06455 [Caulobacter segnis]
MPHTAPSHPDTKAEGLTGHGLATLGGVEQGAQIAGSAHGDPERPRDGPRHVQHPLAGEHLFGRDMIVDAGAAVAITAASRSLVAARSAWPPSAAAAVQPTKPSG